MLTAAPTDEFSLLRRSTDQDRSVDFYEQRLGFEKRTDVEMGGGYRWREVTRHR